jgi:hypothetical protein
MNKRFYVTIETALKYIVVSGGIYFYVSGKEIKLRRVLLLNAVFSSENHSFLSDLMI